MFSEWPCSNGNTVGKSVVADWDYNWFYCIFLYFIYFVARVGGKRGYVLQMFVFFLICHQCKHFSYNFEDFMCPSDNNSGYHGYNARNYENQSGDHGYEP